MTINDGQLDHATRTIEQLRSSMRALSALCSKRLDLLKAVSESQVITETNSKWCSVLMLVETLKLIREETDEHEVET